MFSKQVDVAAIMQEIKRNVVVEEVKEEVINNEVGRITDFVENTRKQTEGYLAIGSVLPQNMRRPKWMRKGINFFYRVVRKCTRFLANDQIKVNQNTNACIKALVESDIAVCARFEQELAVLKKKIACLETSQREQEKVANMFTSGYKNMRRNEGRLEDIEQRINQVSEKVDAIEKKMIPEEIVSDEMYLAFEEKFRGNESDISDRQDFYVAEYLKDLKVEDDSLALDLGCGRGEWLKKMSKRGYRTVGVDINSSMVSACEENGVEAVNSDALEYLEAVEDSSVDVLSAFQVIEHLSKAEVTKLVKEAYRVLKTGGILILETPNICNVEVGAASFHLDPTHINAVHPSFLQFMAEHMGYTKAEIAYWKQKDIEKWLETVVSQEENGTIDSAVLRTVLESMKNLIYTSPDYALVAVK